MPTLEFKGKQFIYSHHLSVPFRELKVDAAKSFAAPGQKPSLDDNLIIHGDNLEALKAMLPTHAGKIDCIFIDPPYNTGNEGWCYNDNVRSPLMKEWLKKSANPVDKEDLERHDKWLCMMWPRLWLLNDLLAPWGSKNPLSSILSPVPVPLPMLSLKPTEKTVATVALSLWNVRTTPIPLPPNGCAA